MSIVVPCYNASRYIGDTLNSVLEQTLPDWEAIIVDDGSTDNSTEIIQQFVEQDRRISLLQRRNSGVSKARNAGSAAANGKYLAFLDADDIWHPDYLQRMAIHLNAWPHIGISFAIARIVDSEGKPTGSYSSVKSSGLDTFDFISSNPTTTCSNLMVRKEIFQQLGGFPEDLCHAEDQLFLIKAHLGGICIEGCHEILVDYRINSSGLSSDLEAMREGWEKMLAQAAAEAPATIEPLIPRARALNLCYLARRALRIRSASDPWFYMSGALSADWQIMLARPWPTIPLTAACWLASFMKRSDRSLAEKSL